MSLQTIIIYKDLFRTFLGKSLPYSVLKPNKYLGVREIIIMIITDNQLKEIKYPLFFNPNNHNLGPLV